MEENRKGEERDVMKKIRKKRRRILGTPINDGKKKGETNEEGEGGENNQ